MKSGLDDEFVAMPQGKTCWLSASSYSCDRVVIVERDGSSTTLHERLQTLAGAMRRSAFIQRELVGPRSGGNTPTSLSQLRHLAVAVA